MDQSHHGHQPLGIAPAPRPFQPGDGQIWVLYPDEMEWIPAELEE